MALDYQEVAINVRAPIKGMNVEDAPADLQNEETPLCENVAFDQGAVHTRTGYVRYGPATPLTDVGEIESESPSESESGNPTPVMNMVDFLDASGNWHKVAWTKAAAYVITESAATRIGEAFWTGDRDDLMVVAEFPTLTSKHLLVTNGVDNVRWWDGTGDWHNLTDHSELESESPSESESAELEVKAKAMVVFFNHLFLLSTIEAGANYPQRVRWCSVADDSMWYEGTAGYFDLVDTPGEVMAGVVVGTSLLILKTDSVYRINWTGTSFTVNSLATGVTCAARLGVGVFKSGAAWLGSDRIYFSDGMSRPEPIDRNVYREVFKMPSAYMGRSVGLVDPFTRRFRLCVPDGAGELRGAWVLDFDRGSWSQEKYGRLCESAVVVSNSRTWNDYKNIYPDIKWSDMSMSWQDLYNTIMPTVKVFGDEDGNIWRENTDIYTDKGYYSGGELVDGEAIVSQFQTKDFSPSADHIEEYYFFKQFSAQIKGSGTLQVWGISESGESLLGSIVLSPDWVESDVWFRLTARQLRFKLVCEDGHFSMKWFRVRWAAASEVPN